MPKKKTEIIKTEDVYDSILSSVVELLEQSRRLTARSVNAVMTATYWEIGRRIVEVEQKGEERAEYGEQVLERLAQDLTAKFGRGFSLRNLRSFRAFYSGRQIRQTLSAEFKKSRTASGKSEIVQTVSAQPSNLAEIAKRFPLPWSHYVLLLSCRDEDEREFYETESLRGGWSVRQLKRQKDSQFYKRALLSKNKAAMLKKGEKAEKEDYVSPDEEIKDPFVLEFLNLKDEYSELDLEEAIIKHLQDFLLEMGAGFAFVGRQMRLRVGDEWYRVDLVLFNRRLRCLVIIDLKLGKLTHADIGQMLLYTGYADKHWREAGENPPVGLILCDENNAALAHYTLDNLPNKVLAKEYKMILPDEKILVEQIEKTRKIFGEKTTANRQSPIANFKMSQIIETEETLIIETPERVPLAFALASIGNRFLAVAIDHFIQYFVIFVTAWAFLSLSGFGNFAPEQSPSQIFQDMSKWTIALMIVVLFLIFAGYFIFFEWLWSGQTPGKRLLKLRVIREDGRPITLWEALARNLLRIFDAVPGFVLPVYSIGLITIFMSNRDQRIGDMFAGTVVVRERAGEAPTFQETFSNPISDAAFRRVQKPTIFQADVNSLTESEIEVAESFLRRRWDLTERQRLWMAWRVALPLMYKIKPAYDLQNFTYEGFLEEIVHRFHSRQRFLN